MKIKTRITAALATTVLIISGTAGIANAWEVRGGCAPTWQVWNRDRMCGTVVNNSNTHIMLIKNWHTTARGEPIWHTNFSPENKTGLSPGRSFGYDQGYDVDGVCAPSNRNLVLTTNGGPNMFGVTLPAGKCYKISDGMYGWVTNN